VLFRFRKFSLLLPANHHPPLKDVNVRNDREDGEGVRGAETEARGCVEKEGRGGEESGSGRGRTEAKEEAEWIAREEAECKAKEVERERTVEVEWMQHKAEKQRQRCKN
jgi:hypothetical protein